MLYDYTSGETDIDHTMKIVNDNLGSPLQIINEGGKVFGQFYNSYDKLLHLSEYIPFKVQPSKYLCERRPAHFVASRDEGKDRRICAGCFTKVIQEA